MNIEEITKALNIEEAAELMEIAEYEEWEFETDSRGVGI